MKFHNPILYFFFLILTSCQSTSMHVKLAHQEMFSFAEEVKKSDNLQLLSYGGGFLNGIDNLTLGFSSPGHPNVDESRRMFFDISNRFLTRVNNCEALRDYLVVYPFTIDNLDLTIIFPRDIEGTISGVSMGESFENHKRTTILYLGYNFSTKDLDVIHEESYKRASGILEHQDNLRNTSHDGKF